MGLSWGEGFSSLQGGNREAVSSGEEDSSLRKPSREAGRFTPRGARKFGEVRGWVNGEPKLRGRLRISQREISRRTGIKTSTISRIFSRGSGSLELVARIALVVGMTILEFAKAYLKDPRKYKSGT